MNHQIFSQRYRTRCGKPGSHFAMCTTSRPSLRPSPRKLEARTCNVGAKALLLRVDEQFAIFVLPADRQLDSGAVKRHMRAKRIRFATAEELLQLTGLVPGSLPPFGQPILPFELFADNSIGVHQNKVAFNAGSLTDSIVMAATDWEAFAKPTRFSFAKPQVQ